MKFIVLAASLLAFAKSPSPSPTASPTRVSNWTCELSGFSSGTRKQQKLKHPELTGQGVVTCKNSSGFATEFPIAIHLQITRDPKQSKTEQMKVTISSEPFAVNKDFHRYYGRYELDGTSPKMIDDHTAKAMVKNQDGSLVLPLKFTVPTSGRGDWEINTLTISQLE